MTIGIDYDGTFSADPDLWRVFVRTAQQRGHTCVCVTGRSDEAEFGAEVKRGINGLMPIVFAGLTWKRQAAKISGYDVDVWVDDNPEYIAEQNVLFSQHKVSTAAQPVGAQDA